MIANLRPFRRLSALVPLIAAGALASCGSMTSAPQQVQASNPTVTYNYRTDQELVQANQRAATFCGQYQTAPRTLSITNNPDGSRAVVFECVRTAGLPPAPPVPPAPPGQRYTYRTDQELIQASETAGAYCRTYGSQ